MKRFKQSGTTLRIATMLMILILISAVFSIKIGAQVTVGSGISPREGLVLDMNADITTNMNKGMGLPKAALNSVYELTLAGNPAQLQGTLVYNTNNGIIGGTGVGVYNWDGDQWQAVSQWLRLDTVYVDPGNVENIKLGEYKTLQRAYDMESRKIFNQLAGQAVVFICSGGDVGGLTAKGTIPSITLNGDALTQFDGRLIFNFSTIRLEGVVNTNGKIVTVNNSFLFMGNSSTALSLTAGSLNLEKGMAVASTKSVDVNLVNNLALDYNSTMVVGITSLKAKSILVRRGSVLEINEGSLVISNKTLIESVSSFLLYSSNTTDNATLEGVLASGNSSVEIRVPVVLKNKNAVYDGFNSLDNSTIKISGSILVDTYYSSVLTATTGGAIHFGALSTSANVAPDQIGYVVTKGVIVHNDGLINATVTTRGFYANNGGAVILTDVENLHTIYKKGVAVTTSAGLMSTGGSSTIELHNKNTQINPGGYVFDGFQYGMFVVNGGKIYSGGFLDVSMSVTESNYQIGTNLGTILNDGSVIYNVSNQIVP